MSLDLGSVFGTVDLITEPFDVKYAAVIRRFSTLGVQAERSGAQITPLDRALAGVGASSTEAAAGLTRADLALRETSILASQAAGATTEAGLAQSKLAQSSLRASGAQQRLNDLHGAGAVLARKLAVAEVDLAALQMDEGAAEDKVAAATERVNVLRAQSLAITGRLASAQASMIAANDRVALSHERVGAATMLGAQSADRMRSTWQRVPAPVKAAGVAMVVAAVASLHLASDFQTSTTRIHTQAGATLQAVDQMRAGILKLAGPTAQAPNELADAMFHIASSQQGIISTAKQLGVLKAAAEGAKLGGADLVDVTNALDAAVVAGIPGVKSFDQAMGALNATVGAGDMTMQNLAEALGTGVLAVVKGYGVTLQQAGAALATFGDNNIRGAQAGTQLRMVVQSLTVPSRLATDALAKLGLTGKDAFTHFADDLKKGGLTLALQDLHERLVANVGPTKAWGEVLTQAFTKRAGSGLNVLVQQFDRYNSKLGEVDARSKNFAADWQAYTQTFQYALHSVIATAEAAGIAFGDKLLPDATRALRWIGTDGVRDVEALWHALKTTGGLNAVGSALGHIASTVGHVAAALGPFEHELLLVGGGAVLLGLHALAAVLDGVAAAVDGVTGFLADSKVAAYVLAGVLTGALVPAVAEAVLWFGRMIAVNAGAAIMVVRAAVAQASAAFIEAGRGAAGLGAAMTALEFTPMTAGLLAAGAAAGLLAYALFTGETAAEHARAGAEQYVKSLDVNYNSLRSVASAEDALTARITARTAALQKMTIAQLSAAHGGPIVGRADQNDTAAQLEKIRQQAIATDPVLAALKDQLAQVQANEAKVASHTNELSRTLGVNESAVRRAAAALGLDLTDAYAKLLPKIADFIASAELSHHPAQQAASDFRSLGNAASSTSDDIGLLDDAWNNLIGNWTSSKAAIASAKAAIQAFNVSFAKTGSLSGDTAQKLDAMASSVKAAIDGIYAKNGHFTEQGIKQVHQLVNAMTAHLPKGSAAYKNLVDRADAYMRQLEQEAPQHGKKTGSGYADGIGSQASRVRREASKIGNAAKAALTEPGAAAPQGADLTRGFAAGMHSDSAFVAIASAAALVISKAISALHTHGKGGSPYKRFIPEGRFLVQGFALGMDAGASDIDRAAGRMVKRARDAVTSAIAAAVRPDVTDPDRLKTMLGHASTSAVDARRQTLIAHDIYRDLKDSAKSYDQQAKAADKAAEKAKKHADAMKADSAAEKAAKKSAEDHAKSLEKLAHEADRTAKEADRAAEHGQKTWQKLQEAADKATQKAIADAEQLVAAVQDQVGRLESTISDFRATVAQGLTGDYSLASIYGDLLDAQTTAASDLADATATYQQAQQAVIDAGVDATADQLRQVTDAQNALTAAQAAADQANAAASVTGVQSSLDQVLARAQAFASDLQSLIGEGAGQALISQLVGMGPIAGDMLAKQLLNAGVGSVMQLSSTLDQIASYTDQVSSQISRQFYGAGIDSMEAFIAGLISKFPDLAAALQPILDELEAIFTITPTFDLTNLQKVNDTGLVGPSPGKFQPRSVPHFAAGVRDFAGGWAQVGEYGPEYVQLPAGSSVFPHGVTPVGSDGASLDRVVDQLRASNDRLDRIEKYLETAPAATGDAVAAASLAGYREAGKANARMTGRNRRAGR